MVTVTVRVDGAALAVGHRDREGLDLGLADSRDTRRPRRHAVGPGHHAAGAGAGGVGGDARRQGAERAAGAGGAVADTLCTSVRSTSVKAMVPLSVRLPTGVTSSVTPPVHVRRRPPPARRWCR